MDESGSLRVCVVDLNGPFGPLRSYLDLVPYLEESGVVFHFVVPERSEELVKRRVANPDISLVAGAHSVGRDRTVRQLVKESIRSGTTVVHANSTSAARATVAIGAPVVTHLRNSSLSQAERLMLAVLAAAPAQRSFIAVSDGASRLLPASVRRRTTVIGDAVRPPITRPDGPPEAGKWRVGVVVNQQPTKGFDVFARVAQALADHQIEWQVFGSAGLPDGNEYTRRIRLALSDSPSAQWIRYRGTPDLHDEYQRLDAVLITSRRESFSRVAAEAMLARVPLVAPRIPGLIETVGGGQFAALYDVEDHAGAASRLEDLVRDYDTALARASAAQPWGSMRFDAGRVADAIFAEYRRLG